MTDRKISELPAATLPLAGTELVPLVQDSVTEQVPASALGKVNGFLDLAATDPTAPAAGNVRLFRREIAGRQMLAFVGPSGLDTAVQPHLARNKIGRWSPTGGINQLHADGLTAPNVVGTATARQVATTNRFTRTRRLGYVSAATAGSFAGIRNDLSLFSTGNGTDGGFHLIVRFGFSALVSDARAFMGMRNALVGPPNVEPSTLTNSIGIGRGAADTNLRLFFGGSAAQTPIDLGANFPANTVNIDLYELALFAPPSQVGVVNWQVTRLNTGHVASGQLSGGAAVVPDASVLMGAFNSWVGNNATAAAVAFDLVGLMIETDY